MMLVLVAGVLAAPHDAHAAVTLARANDIYYRGTDSFMSIKRSPPAADRGFDWSDDGCSVPFSIPTVPSVVWFPDQCRQHDFGYRNYGSAAPPRLDPTESRRRSVDDHFYGRMNARCGAWWIRYGGQEPVCLASSLAFYGAVRNFGRL